MVEAEISPEMMKRKRKKKKRKKDVRPVAPADEQVKPVAHHREFGPSAVPRLPKLPAHNSLVANLWERQQEENVLPGSFPDFRPSCTIPRQDRYIKPGYVFASQRSRDPDNLANVPKVKESQYEGRGQYKQPAWQSNGAFRYLGQDIPVPFSGGRSEVAPRSEARRHVVAPIHSRTNLMDELMDADSDF